MTNHDNLRSAWRLPDDCLTTAWPMFDYCLKSAWQLHDNCLATPWQLQDNCLTTIQCRISHDCLLTGWQLADDCLVTAWRLLMTARQLPDEPDICLMTAWWLPDDYLMTAWWLPDDCLMTAWWLPDDCPMSYWWQKLKIHKLLYLYSIVPWRKGKSLFMHNHSKRESDQRNVNYIASHYRPWLAVAWTRSLDLIRCDQIWMCL